MDLIVAFPLRECSKFAEAKTLLWTHLKGSGYDLYNEHPAHFTANRCDIFVGFIEPDESVSWFPSRRGRLTLSDVYPTITRQILDIPCEIPRDCERYLEVTYGLNWRSTSSNFIHPWDQSQYPELGIGEKLISGS
jgi:hypothetical protein